MFHANAIHKLQPRPLHSGFTTGKKKKKRCYTLCTAQLSSENFNKIESWQKTLKGHWRGSSCCRTASVELLSVHTHTQFIDSCYSLKAWIRNDMVAETWARGDPLLRLSRLAGQRDASGFWSKLTNQSTNSAAHTQKRKGKNLSTYQRPKTQLGPLSATCRTSGCRQAGIPRSLPSPWVQLQECSSNALLQSSSTLELGVAVQSCLTALPADSQQLCYYGAWEDASSPPGGALATCTEADWGWEAWCCYHDLTVQATPRDPARDRSESQEPTYWVCIFCKNSAKWCSNFTT